jgi:hypothetical protein
MENEMTDKDTQQILDKFLCWLTNQKRTGKISIDRCPVHDYLLADEHCECAKRRQIIIDKYFNYLKEN